MVRALGLPLPGSVGPFAHPTHRVVYWCPAMRAGAGGWYALGWYRCALHAAQAVVLAQALGYHSASVQVC